MPQSDVCDHCENNIPPSADRCPHCGLPGLFPNVRAAEDASERAVLDGRYELAKTASSARDAIASLDEFENLVAGSKAVIARSANELERLATSDNELYATYYQFLAGRLRLPAGDKWDILRVVADSALFPNYKEHIRFAALTLDGMGLFNYGECSIVLRENMIAHRASVFEENSVLFMKHHNIPMSKANKLPKGYRATWENRARLCVAKLHKRIDASTKADEYSALLLRQGATGQEDEFVEAHIYGPMTMRTIEQVIISPRTKRRQTAIIIKAMKEKLLKAGVTIN